METVLIRFDAVDNVTPALRRVQVQVKNTISHVDRLKNAFKNAFSVATKTASTVVTSLAAIHGATTALYVGLVQSNMETERLITLISSISGESIGKVNSSLEKLATSLPNTTKEVANVAYELSKVGLTKSALWNVTRMAIEMGNAFNISASEIGPLIAMISDMNSGVKSLEDRMHMVAKAFSISPMGLEKLKYAIQNAGGTVQTLGVKYEDFLTIATLAIDKNKALEASVLGTGLNIFLRELISAPEKLSKVLSEIQGIPMDILYNEIRLEVFNPDGTVKDLGSVLSYLHEKLGTIGDKSKELQVLFDVFGKEGATVIQTLINNAGDFKSIQDKLKQGIDDKTLTKMTNAYNKTVAGSWGLVQSKIEAIGKKIFDNTKDKLIELLQELNRLFDTILKNKELMGIITDFFNRNLNIMIDGVKWLIKTIDTMDWKKVREGINLAYEAMSTLKQEAIDTYNRIKDALLKPEVDEEGKEKPLTGQTVINNLKNLLSTEFNNFMNNTVSPKITEVLTDSIKQALTNSESDINDTLGNIEDEANTIIDNLETKTKTNINNVIGHFKTEYAVALIWMETLTTLMFKKLHLDIKNKIKDIKTDLNELTFGLVYGSEDNQKKSENQDGTSPIDQVLNGLNTLQMALKGLTITTVILRAALSAFVDIPKEWAKGTQLAKLENVKKLLENERKMYQLNRHSKLPENLKPLLPAKTYQHYDNILNPHPTLQLINEQIIKLQKKEFKFSDVFDAMKHEIKNKVKSSKLYEPISAYVKSKTPTIKMPNVVTNLIQTISKLFAPITNIISKALSPTIKVVSTIFKYLGKTVLGDLGILAKSMSPHLAKLGATISKASAILSAIFLVIDTIFAAIHSYKENLFGFKTALEDSMNILGGTGKSIIDTIIMISTPIDALFKGVAYSIIGLLAIIIPMGTGIVKFVMTIFDGIFWGIKHIMKVLGVDLENQEMSGFLDFIGKIGSTIGYFMGIVGHILGATIKVVAVLVGWIIKLIGGLWDFISTSELLGGFIKWLGDTLSWVCSMVFAFGEAVYQGFKWMFETIEKEGIVVFAKRLSNVIVDAFAGILKAIIRIAKSIPVLRDMLPVTENDVTNTAETVKKSIRWAIDTAAKSAMGTESEVDKPKAPETPDKPKAPETPEIPDLSDKPTVLDILDKPIIPGTLDIPGIQNETVKPDEMYKLDFSSMNENIESSNVQIGNIYGNTSTVIEQQKLSNEQLKKFTEQINSFSSNVQQYTEEETQYWTILLQGVDILVKEVYIISEQLLQILTNVAKLPQIFETVVKQVTNNSKLIQQNKDAIAALSARVTKLARRISYYNSIKTIRSTTNNTDNSVTNTTIITSGGYKPNKVGGHHV